MPRDFSDKPRKGGKTNGKGKGKGRGKEEDDDKPHGIRLPGSLLDELKTGTAEVEAGDNRYTLSSNFVNKKGGKGKPVSRKEERKAQRQDKKRRKVENQRVQVRDKIINQHKSQSQTSKSNLKTSSNKPHAKKSVKFSTDTKSGPTSHSPEDTDSATESFGEDDDYEEMDFEAQDEEEEGDQPQTVEDTMAALMAMKKAKSLQKDKLEKEQRSKHLENKAKSSTKSTTSKPSQYEEASHSTKREIDPLTESLLRRDEDDIKHYAKLLGMKSTKGKDFKQAKGKNDLDDGLDDLLDGLEFLDEYGSGDDEQAEDGRRSEKSKSLSQKRSRDESESESEEDEDEELEGFSDDEDQPQTADETMAALMAMKAAKNKAQSNGGKPSELKIVKQQESDSEDIDSFGDSSDYEDFEQDADAMEDFSGSDEDMDDDDEEFGDDQPQTVEDTMAALMAMKAAKNNNKKEDKKKKDKKNSNIKEHEPPKKEIDPLTESLLRRDEDDIKHYAKLLGMKSTKVKDMQRDAGDGLDDLFEGLDFLDGYGGVPSEQSEEEEEESEAESESEQDDDQEETVENPFSSDDEINSSDFDDSFGSGEEDDDEEGEGGPASHGETFMAPKNENPYAPATTSSAATTTGKYVPPALRAKQQAAALDGSDANSAEFQILKRQVKGPLNKLSESNTVSIISEILDLYNGNPRQLVTEAITVIVLDSVKQQGVSLLDTFIVLYAALISGIYRVQGVEAGAYFVQTLIEEFELAVKSGDNKISGNLVSLICGVYSFGVVGCKLIYGLIRSLLVEATELNSELLLRIVRACGQSLRSDDPMALRDIVIELQQSALGKDTNSRTKFLIETVTNLKNNKSRALAHSQLTTDLITNLKKQLSKTIKANKKFAEPLQVTLEDIHSVATKGKWWVVGSAWRNNLHGVLDTSSSTNSDLVKEQMNEILDSAEPNWIQLAKSNRMNTDIRRAIFITILSSQDFIDAFTKLDKLRLNKTQEREIPKVLLHCVGMEGAFNPYYGLLGNKLCTGYAMRKAFQFCLWDLIKDIEGDDDDYDNSSDDDDDGETKKRFKLNANDDDMDEDSKLRKLVNLAKFYGSLLSEGSLALHVLKDINFINANEDLTVFLEVLMIQFLDSVGKKSEISSFGSGLPSTEISRNGKSSRASKADDLIFKDDLLIQRLGKCDKQHRMLMGLQWFLTEKVRSSDIISGRKQRKRVEWGCDSGADVIAELVKKGPQDSGKDMDEDSGDEI